MGKMNVPGAMARLVNRPLMATLPMAQFYFGFLAERHKIGGVLIEGESSTPIGDLTAVGAYSYTKDSSTLMVPGTGIAVIDIYGSLAHKQGTIQPYSGMTGYDGIQFNIAAAAADPNVKGVLLDVHSGGGEVTGAFDTADALYALAKQKPVWCLADEMAYSAAYLLASQASRITTPRTGGVGSVGVIALHVDESRAVANEGLQVTVFKAGAKKDSYSSLKPLSADDAAQLQASIEQAMDLFVAAVCRGNDMTAQAVRDTQAACLDASEALSIGFIDAIQPAADTIAEFAAYLAQPARTFSTSSAKSSMQQQEKNTMRGNQPKPSAQVPAQQPAPRASEQDAPAGDEEEDAPAEQPAPQPVQDPPKDAVQAAVKAERDRQANLELLAQPGEDVLLARMKADGTDVATAALQFAAHRRAAIAAAASVRRAETPQPIARNPASEAPKAGAVKSEGKMSDAELTARYEGSEDLQAEFSAVGDYVAFVRAEASGGARILKK